MRLIPRLQAAFPRLLLEKDFSFSRHTAIGCGGSAEAAASPSSYIEAARLLAFLERRRIPYCLLGAGANVLPSDGRFEGVVVRFSRLGQLRIADERILAGAGVTGGRLLAAAQKAGVGGLSPFSGIPMTVGGGTAMNAGVRDLHFSDVVQAVLCSEKGKIGFLRGEACRFREKSSLFSEEKVAVLAVLLRGRRARSEDIARESCYYRSLRARLPKGRSMGCTFVNPAGVSAGALIEACGLKGARAGGAVVSDRHANFILSENGRAADVAALIELIRTIVQKKTGILLREEIRRIP